MSIGASMGGPDRNLTLLTVAAQACHKHLAEMAIGKLAEGISDVDSLKISFLRAVECGHSDIVHLLVENGADIESSDEHGWTALHMA